MQIPGLIDFSSGDEAKAQVEGKIADTAQQFIQKQFVDPAMEKKGQNAAEQEGASFQEMPGYTEAQRAYNKAGDPIAASMLSTDLQSQANQYFFQAKQNGFPADAAETFGKQMQAYSDQTRNTQSPQLHALTIEGSNKLTALYGRQIQAAQFKQQRAQSAVASNNQRETLLQGTEGMGYQVGSSQPQNFATAYLALHKNIESLELSGNLTPQQAFKAAEDGKLRIQRSQMVGDIRNLTTILNSPGNTPAEKAIAAKNLANAPDTIFTNKAFAGKNTYQLHQEAETLAKESLKSVAINTGASKQALKNMVAQVVAGKQYDTGQWNTDLSGLSVTDQNQYNSDMAGAHATNQASKVATGNSVAENFGASTAPVADIPGVMPKDLPALKAKIQANYKSTGKTLLHDPWAINQGNAALASMQNQTITGLTPTGQKTVNMTFANAALGLLGPQSPQTIAAINKTYNQRTALSRQQGGPGYFLSNGEASTMWASISKQQPADQVKTLNQIRQTLTPQNFNMLENQIQNTGRINASAFVGSYLSTGENTSNLLDSLHGSQIITKEGKESRNQNEIGAGATVSETLKDLDTGLKHDDLSQTLSKLTTGFIGAGRTADASGLRNIAANYFLSQEAKGRSSSDAAQDTEDMLNQNYTMYTSNNSNVVIPNHYIDDSGKSQQTDMDSVHTVMNYMVSNPDRFIDYSNSFKRVAAANPNNKFNAAAAKAKLKVGLHWVGTPSGGFAMVNSIGAPLLSKGGMPVGFDAKNADDYAAKIKAFHEKDEAHIGKDSPFFRAIAPWANT